MFNVLLSIIRHIQSVINSIEISLCTGFVVLAAIFDEIQKIEGAEMVDVNHLVGSDAMLIPANSNGERIAVKIIGFCRNESLMVTLKNEDAELSDEVLNSSYQLRVSSGNVVYTFNTYIKVVHHEPMSYLHLSLPDAEQQVTERQSPRISVKNQELTLSVSTGQEHMKASMADISLEGARLVAKHRLAKIDEMFYIDMLVDNGTSTITLPCKVRYVRTDIQTEGQESIVFHHGVEFGELSESAEQFIGSFIRVSAR